LYENYRQDLILYFIVKRQRKLLAENKQFGEDQATELRHMIANVAHDLKTVLSSFNLFILLSRELIYSYSFSRCPPL
jgi:signal transduction histidine kinase